MYRTHTCGELRLADQQKTVTLAGWVQRIRNMGAMTFIDLRDRYGITQLTVDQRCEKEVEQVVETLGREYVINITGTVLERTAKNPKIPTGDIEVLIQKITVLNAAETPPFTIEDNTDGGEELRAKFRYLDLRRNPLQRALELRHKVAFETRNYFDKLHFLEIETPVLISSTPEGARDFVVPSRIHKGKFYALPQSPQTFKQLLMVAGYDRYFQIVRCFRDEDLRADRQPEFTQIDCEMSFVERQDILDTFGGLMTHLFHKVLAVDIHNVPLMTYAQAMEKYGCDKPDVRFEMLINDITGIVKGKGFPVFDEAEYTGALVVEGAGNYSRKMLDELTEFVKRPQVGAKGLAYVKLNEEGTKSSFDKFFNPQQLQEITRHLHAKNNDLILILSGKKKQILPALCSLRLEMGSRLGLRKNNIFKPLWVIDFPLFEWDDETQRFYAMHHPFTSPHKEDIDLFLNSKTPQEIEKVRANAYDFVVNGVELGGGSIRIFDAKQQQRMFELLGFTAEDAQQKFGFIINAFKYGAPPHGGIAFGLDRLCSIFGGSESIRDYIAFPKNNAGKDVMIDSPSEIDEAQLKELSLLIKP